MRLAFVLFHWFPHGGLQQDLVKVVRACHKHYSPPHAGADRNHGNAAAAPDISIFCMQWQGAQLSDVKTVLVPAQDWSATARRRKFVHYIATQVSGHYDAVIGFNRMPGLDYYFAADTCFAAKAHGERPWWYRLLPRTRQYLAYEQAVFGPEARTIALLLSPSQREQYQHYYQTPGKRLLDLPPGIGREHCADSSAAEIRKAFREEHGIAAEDLLVLQVGSSFRTKGVARSLAALASLPPDLKRRVRYFLVGRDKPEPWLRRAARAGLADRISIFPALGDIPRFMQGADLLLHPSVAESAGMVILEAIVAGLPVLTTGSCGYAFHVEKAQAGLVCAQAFSQEELNRKLLTMLQADKSQWRAHGIRYGQEHNLYDMPQAVATILLGDGGQTL
jgi:UDP-glucose:(heptosyl)LPS alpha-1,3-glucosyltransferase